MLYWFFSFVDNRCYIVGWELAGVYETKNTIILTISLAQICRDEKLLLTGKEILILVLSSYK